MHKYANMQNSNNSKFLTKRHCSDVSYWRIHVVYAWMQSMQTLTPEARFKSGQLLNLPPFECESLFASRWCWEVSHDITCIHMHSHATNATKAQRLTRRFPRSVPLLKFDRQLPTLCEEGLAVATPGDTELSKKSFFHSSLNQKRI